MRNYDPSKSPAENNRLTLADQVANGATAALYQGQETPEVIAAKAIANASQAGGAILNAGAAGLAVLAADTQAEVLAAAGAAADDLSGAASIRAIAKQSDYRTVTPGAGSADFMFDGDSLTAGSSVGAGEGFVDYLQVMPSVAGRGNVYNVAVGGNTLVQRIAALSTPTTGVLARIAACTADVFELSIWIGANGWINYSSAQAFVTDLEANYVAVCRATALSAGVNLRVIGWTILDNIGTAYVIGRPMRIAINELLRQSSQFDYLVDVDRLFPNAGDIRFFLTDGTHLNGTATTGGNAILAKYVDSILHTQRQGRENLGLTDARYVSPVDKNPVIFTGATGGYFSGAIPDIGARSFVLDITFTPDENNSASRFLFNLSDSATAPDRPRAFYAFISNTAGNRSLVVGISGATASDYRRATVANFVPKYAPSVGTNNRRVAVPVRLQIVRGKAVSSSNVDLSIIINGVQVEYATTTNGTPPANFSDTLITAYYLVGSRGTSGSELTGSVCGFTIWNVPLNLSECLAVYEQGRQALPWYSQGTFTDTPSGSLVRGRSYLVSGGTSITNGSTTYTSGTVFNHVGSSNTYTESGSVDVFPVGPLVDLDFSIRTDASPTTLHDISGNNNDATVEGVALRLIADGV